MRVAVVTTSYPSSPGDPSGHFVATEARRLAEGAGVTVITAGPTGSPRAPSTEAGGVAVWRLDGGGAFGWPGVAARVGERPWRLVAASRWARDARGLLRWLPPFDRIIAHWALPSAFPIARSLGVPLEVVSHGGDVRALLRLPSPARRAVVGRLLDDVDRWRFVSRSLHESLARALDPGQRERLHAVAHIAPAAIDLPDTSARASELRRAIDAERLVVCVGRLVASKRFDRALDHVARGGAAGTRVVVVGDGPERARLEGHARALGVDTRFVGRTSREDALAWIGAADGLLHASEAEGLSTVVREAEALGVPVEIVA